MAENGAALLSVGVVKWFDAQKGYGFIEMPDGQKDVFVHVKELRKAGIVLLKDGSQIRFIPNEGSKGTFATEIAVIDVSGGVANG